MKLRIITRVRIALRAIGNLCIYRMTLPGELDSQEGSVHQHVVFKLVDTDNSLIVHIQGPVSANKSYDLPGLKVG